MLRCIISCFKGKETLYPFFYIIFIFFSLISYVCKIIYKKYYYYYILFFCNQIKKEKNKRKQLVKMNKISYFNSFN